MYDREKKHILESFENWFGDTERDVYCKGRVAWTSVPFFGGAPLEFKFHPAPAGGIKKVTAQICSRDRWYLISEKASCDYVAAINEVSEFLRFHGWTLRATCEDTRDKINENWRLGSDDPDLGDGQNRDVYSFGEGQWVAK